MAIHLSSLCSRSKRFTGSSRSNCLRKTAAGMIGTTGTVGTGEAIGANRCYHPPMWHSIPLTLFWFVYFGSLGIFFPYFSLYLRENAGLSGTQLGAILAISPLVGMIAQPLWGHVADRTGARSRLLAFLTLGTALGYAVLGLAQGFWNILIAMAALALVGTAVFPLVISVSLAILRNAGPHAFGQVRVWGTVGYFILILIFPRLLQFYRPADGLNTATQEVSQPALGLMFPIIAALVLVSAVIGFFLPQKGAVALQARRGDWRQLMRNRPFVRFLFFALTAHFLMHAPMWLFPIFVRVRGGDLDMIRAMWILMLTVEIPLVLLTGSGLKILGARGLLAAGVLAGGLRWTLCAVFTDPALLFAVQALHGATVVGLNLGSPLYLDTVAAERLRSTAQGILSMVGMGIAGIASNIAAGWLMDHGGIDAVYLICGVGSLALGLVTGWLLPAEGKRDEKLAEGTLPSEALP
jgi:PPP family 3-phenylpropionic acid transporter